MYIENLKLINFRNYTDEMIEFKNGINILVGANAQGKTNAVEAIFFLCTGYSPRASKDKLVIKDGGDTATILGLANSDYGKISIKIGFNKADKKDMYVNDIKVLKIGELLGNMHSVFFNPQDLKLVQESPEDRRRFLNISLSQMSKNYFYALQRYNKILEQRNNLLKDPNKEIIIDTLPIWDEQLSKEAGKIIKQRNEFIELIAPIAKEKHAFLTDNQEELTMKTESNYSGDELEIAKQVFSDLRESLEKDLRLGFTTIGPHRDDIKFTLNGFDVRTFGSQGQQRTVALSLKLAETEVFKEKFGEYPILILDDVLSELDKNRQRKLVEETCHLQTIYTATHFDRTVFKNREVNKIEIVNGNVKKKKSYSS